MPKIDAKRDPSDQIWDIIHLRINEFSEDEVAIEGPASSSIASIGEELSTSEVSALAWSPQGLAKYERCALAILTQNLVLSIWTPGLSPRTPHSWNRVIVVNHELERYLKEIRPSASPETLKQLRRIRAFSWSPAAAFDGVNENFMVLANDSNEIIIFWVPSKPVESAGNDAEFSVRALAHFPADPSTDIASIPDSTWTFEDYLDNRVAATHISWSPWAHLEENHSLVAVIAYATRMHLRFRQVHVTMSEGVPKVTVGEQCVKSPFTAPGSVNSSIFVDPHIISGRVEFVVSVGSTLWRHNLAVLGDIDHKSQKYERSHWDPVSGMSESRYLVGDDVD
jgi:hypothetical protein